LFVSQQPFAQLVASQVQAPPTHRCPAAQAAPMPQAHAPFVQRSAVVVQAWQVEAGAPHEVALCAEGATHWLPWQQPPGQLVALHTQAPPLEQVWPAAQAAPVPHSHTPPTQALVDPLHGPQAAPPVPQVVAPWLAGTTHAPALQQPVGQLVESHTQAPAWQRCPAAHAAPVPHAHAPPAQ
jgi:hypothetical protein